MTNFEKFKSDVQSIKEPMELIGYLQGIKPEMLHYCRKHCSEEVNDNSYSYTSSPSISIIGEDIYWNAEVENTNE